MRAFNPVRFVGVALHGQDDRRKAVRAACQTTGKPEMKRALAGVAALPFRPGSAEWDRARRLAEPFAVFVGIFSLFAAVTVVLFWQCIPHLHAALLGPPEDNMQDFWNTWYAAVSANSNFFVTNLIRFPEGTPLYYHSFAYPKVFAIAFLWKVFGGADAVSLVLMQNLGLLISFPLAGTGAFYLVRHFTGSNAGALLGGFVFAFNPSHIQHAMHHAGVSSIEFIPFFILFYLLAIERKNLLCILGAIAFYVLSALSCWYYLFYLTYFMAFHVIYLAVRDRALPSGWQLFASVAILAGAFAMLAPILLPMVSTALGGAPLHIEGSDNYVADLFAYFAFPSYHAVGPLADGIYARLTGNEWEATVYLGLVNIAVLAWLCFAAPEKNKQLVLYVLCGMAVFCTLAAGDSLHVLGTRTVPMPNTVLSQVPFFSNVRTPSRVIVLVYIFLAIGVGHALGLAMKHRPGRVARSGVGALALLVVLDFAPVRQLAVTPIACSPGLAIVRDDPEKGFAVLDLPSRGYNEGNFYMMQQAVCHGRPILHGNTSRNVVQSLRDLLESSDFEALRRRLVDAKVKYIVLHSRREALDMKFAWAPQDGARSQYLRTFPIVYDSPEVTILRVY
jgi:hypothetical protein